MFMKLQMKEDQCAGTSNILKGQGLWAGAETQKLVFPPPTSSLLWVEKQGQGV